MAALSIFEGSRFIGNGRRRQSVARFYVVNRDGVVLADFATRAEADAALSAPSSLAALWLFSQASSPSPIVPALQQRFGLSAKGAVDVIREAGEIRRAGR